MTRKPVFWIVLFILSILGVLFTFRFFPAAFPLVNVDISMSRQQALSRAQQLAQEHGWGPQAFRQAASFSLDSELQHFVELEAGGVEKFNQLLDGRLYSPYQWIVRHFQEGEKTETLIRFTPDGRFYGFAEQLPENQPGAALSADSALAIATAGAAKWEVDLSAYQLAEQSQERQIGGRVDHTFVYERSDEKLGEGLYRLRLTVAGDELTELRHFVKIPEAFQRRYQEMRSANETLAMVAMFAMILLYGVLGIGVGLFFQLRERWIRWRMPLICGCVVALLQVLDAVNNWPLAWMGYDTALSQGSFFMRQIFQLVTIFFAEALLLTLTFMAAEGLTRKAFPNQIQLWKTWRPDAARSAPVLGHTLGGLLGVSLFFAFDTALYLFAGRVLGWWTPSSSLFEPDVLATYQPWLSSIAISLHAGFWEECLFRAIPIAGAALLGRRFGKEKLWIIGAFIVQALIFGGGHANYPTQPAYARLVELVVPSVAFGLIYLSFGLLPAIILHFAYDVVWFAMPLFVSSAPAIWVQQVLVILFTLAPLWIVLRARLAKKAWLAEAPDDVKNRSFVPVPARIVRDVKPKEVAATRAIKGINVWLAAAGVVGVVLWFLFADVRNMAPKLTLGRSEATAIAQNELAQRGIELPAGWKMLSRVEAPLNINDRFIWQEEGDSVYASLMETYIGAPFWLVRCANFEGDVAARAEEYQIKIGDNKAHFQHILPEKAAGDSLTEAMARPIAQAALARFGLEAAGLKEVSMTPSKLENRMDWEFVWADTAGHPLASGECRILVQLAGSEVANAYQYVHVPEEWSRAEREKTTILRILDAAFGAVPILLLVVAFVYAIIYWSRKQFDVVIFAKIAVLLSLISLFNLLNSWPMVTSMFLTAMPWQHQALIAIIFSALGALAIGVAIGMINGFLKPLGHRIEGKPAVRAVAALGAGVLIVALMTIVRSFAPSLMPPWADYDALGSLWPLPGLALGFILRFLTMGSVFLLIATVADRFSASWTRHKVVTALLFVLLGIALTDVNGAGSIPFWLIGGVVKGGLLCLTYILVLRHRPALAPWVYLPFLLFQGVRGIMQAAFPGAAAGLALGLLLVVVVAVVWERWLRVD